MTSETGTPWAAAVSGLAAATVRARLLNRFTTVADLLTEVTSDSAVMTAMSNPAASFVTLRREQRLRGCIGNLVPNRPMHHGIVHNARQAMVDPRMAPVAVDEWPRLTVEVSVLSEPEQLGVVDRTELVAALRPGVDGLTVRHADRRATFLPTVWQSLDTPEKFISALLAKGGWDEPWPTGMSAERYTTQSFTDHPPRPELEPT